jgi:hypothetical protein
MFGLLVCYPTLFIYGALAYIYGAALHFSASHGFLLQVRVFFRVLNRAHQHRQVPSEIRKICHSVVFECCLAHGFRSTLTGKLSARKNSRLTVPFDINKVSARQEPKPP